MVTPQRLSDRAAGASELVFHGVRRRPWRVADDPVGTCLGLESQVQQILAAQAHDERGGHDGDDKQQAHDNRRRDLGKENSEFEPQPVQGCEYPRPQQGGRKESDGERQRPEARRVAAQQRPHSDDRENHAEHDAEAALGADPYIVVRNALVLFVLGHARFRYNFEAKTLTWPDATAASVVDTATTGTPANDNEPEDPNQNEGPPPSDVPEAAPPQNTVEALPKPTNEFQIASEILR
jgi:hypothetical protein